MSQQPPAPPEEPRSLGDQVKLAGAVIAGLALLLFFLQNLQEVELHFLWWTGNLDMIWALILSALLGAVAMLLGQTFWSRRRRPPAPPKD